MLNLTFQVLRKRQLELFEGVDLLPGEKEAAAKAEKEIRSEKEARAKRMEKAKKIISVLKPGQ